MFNIPADAYERYMGLWSRPLARAFVDAAGLELGQRALDVGCGKGGHSIELARRFGFAVLGIDPVERHLVLSRADIAIVNDSLKRIEEVVRLAEQSKKEGAGLVRSPPVARGGLCLLL